LHSALALFVFKPNQILTDTDQHDKSGDRRNSMFSGDADGAAKVKAQIKAATSEHLKEGGEEDDSDSDHEGLDPSEVGVSGGAVALILLAVGLFALKSHGREATMFCALLVV